MDPQPKIAVQGLDIGDRCPCDDGQPDECPYVANEEIITRAAAVCGLQGAAYEATAHMTYREASEILMAAYSAVERA